MLENAKHKIEEDSGFTTQYNIVTTAGHAWTSNENILGNKDYD